MVVLIGSSMLAIGVVLFLLLPILRGESASLERFEGELTDAEARKRAALRALRDVDYDFHTGKLDDSDYQELKNVLSRDALAAMQKAEREKANFAAGGYPDDLEAEIARVRAGLTAGTTCPSCGHPNPDESRFCSMCGGAMVPAAAPEETAASE